MTSDSDSDIGSLYNNNTHGPAVSVPDGVGAMFRTPNDFRKTSEYAEYVQKNVKVCLKITVG